LTTVGETRVSYERAGSVIAQATVSGDLLNLALPETLLVEQGRDEVLIVEKASSFAEFCGVIPLLSVKAGRITITELRVPAPWPFTDGDVKAMWLARARLRLRRRKAMGGEEDWASLARTTGEGLALRYLQYAHEHARQILAVWPTRHIGSHVTKSLERSGGRLLPRASERHARVVVAGTDGPVPLHTVRAVTSAEERTFWQLSVVAAAVSGRLLRTTVLDGHEKLRSALVTMFRRLATRSRPRTRVDDPPMSTWPASARNVYWSCVTLLSALEDIATGTAAAPLSPLWELYEAWVVEELTRALELRLGPAAMTLEPDAIGTWQVGEVLTSIYYQATIPPAGNPSRVYAGRPLVSVMGEMVPDVLITRREEGTASFLVVDAKKYGTYIDIGALAENASKYLWSVREESSPVTNPVLRTVVLAAPLGGVQSHPAGRASVFRLHPASGISEEQLDMLFASLTAAPCD